MHYTSIIAAADWRTDRRARCILASLAKHPPVAIRLASHEQWDRIDSAFTGYRVEALSAVREQIVGAQLKEAESMGDVPLMKAVCAQIGTQDAVWEVMS